MNNTSVYKKLQYISKKEGPLSNYAFSLFLFIKRMVDKAISDQITDLFFLSREGKFLKRLYDEYVEINDVEQAPKSHYFYVSRKSVINATLKPLDQEKFKSLSRYRKFSVKEFLSALSFSQRDMVFIEKQMNEDTNLQLFDFFNSALFEKLKQNEHFKLVYERNRVEYRRNFDLYLKKSGYCDAKRIALVDVGWKGTMQNHLYQARIRNELQGYYLGYMPEYTLDLDNQKTGLLFNTKSTTHVFAHFCYNYEYVCVADHGCVCRYDSEGTPILSHDGDVDLYNATFGNIQERIEEKFKRICECIRDANISDRKVSRYCTYRHIKMLNDFSKTENEILRNAMEEHSDFVDIKTKKTLKKSLVEFRRAVYIKAQCLKYSFWFI